MIEISREMALYLYNSDNEVFMLFNDGTECVADLEIEIRTHEGIFGIEEE